MLAVLTACHPKSSGGGPAPAAPAAPEEGKPAAPIEPLPPIDVPLAEVVADGCLQLPKLAAKLGALKLPAATMTVDHYARSEMPPALRKYFAFASFEYRRINTAALLPFPSFTQEGCKALRTTTASGEPVTFTITKGSDSGLTLERAKTAKEIPSYVAKALDKRARAEKYVIRYEAFTRSLTVETRYSAIDPLCGQEKRHDLATTRKITWARTGDQLPETYAIAPEYLRLLKEATIDGQVPGSEEGLLHVSAFVPLAPAAELMKCR